MNFFFSDPSRPFFIGFLPTASHGKRQSFSFFLDEKNIPARFIIARFFLTKKTPHDLVLSRGEYLFLVKKAIEKIHTGVLQKVVVSRIKPIERAKTISLPDLLDDLRQLYPNAFVYAFRDAAGEMWMGATPELLLRRRHRQYETVALAGTQPCIEGKKITDYVWGEKEKSEQAIVSSYIVEQIKSNGGRNISLTSPMTVQAGKVVHLKSQIVFESDETPEYWLRILHPTPAVCGFPKVASLQFILENEQYDRSYYTGYLGVERSNGDADFFVNLRCMRITENYFDLFVGGGIMADSIPQAEWEETEWKAKTLLTSL